MKRWLLRSLLLMAAAGYFLAGTHSAMHLHLPGEAQCHHSAAQAETPAGEEEKDDACALCLVHAHAVAFVPLALASEPTRFKTVAPLRVRAALFSSTPGFRFGARAPPHS